MRYRALCGFFFFSLVATSTTFAADYGIFKSEWNKIIVNTNVVFNPNNPPEERKSVFVRSISLKCINSELSSDWKEALRGLKTYYCAVRVDVDVDGLKSDLQYSTIVADFYDENGLVVVDSPVPIIFYLSSDVGVSKSVTLYSSLSHGAPVSVEFRAGRLSLN
jgi:hypothetical protein